MADPCGNQGVKGKIINPTIMGTISHPWF